MSSTVYTGEGVDNCRGQVKSFRQWKPFFYFRKITPAATQRMERAGVTLETGGPIRRLLGECSCDIIRA